MSHNMATELTGMQKESKGKGKIKSIHIRVLDDGTFMYTADTDKMNSHDYSYQSVSELMKGLKDDLVSPHLREPEMKAADYGMKETNVKIKSSGKESQLKKELMKK